MVIPADWAWKTLGDVTSLIPGGVYGEEFPRTQLIGMPVATTAHIEMSDRWNSKEMNIRYFSKEHVQTYAPQFGDLIVVKSSGSAASIQSGKLGFVDQNRAGKFIFSNFLMLLRPLNICPKFLYFYVSSNNVKRLIPTLVEASTYPNIRIPEYLEVQICVPPLKEQEAIAEALSDADAAIESLDALIVKKRDVKQATMQQLLTGRTRLPGFTADWKEVRLGDLGTCLRGVSYKGDSDLSDGDTPTTVRLLRSNNVQNSLIQFNDVQYVNHDCVSDEQILRRDDIVICMANGSKVLVGKTGLYKDSQDARYTFGAFMACFRSSSDQAHAVFVRYLFLTKQYQDYISNLLAGSSINNLTPKSIESLLFNVPPLKEQEAIAEALTVMDDELEGLTEQVLKLRMVKEGMMQDLLTGKVRLV